MRVAADVAREHFLIAFEATAGEHNIGREEVMKKAIVLADFQATNSAGVVGQEANSFSFVMYVAVVEFADVLKDFLDNSVATAVWKDKVLVGVEFKQDVRFIMVDEFDAPILQISSTDWCLLAQLLTVVFVSHAVAHPSHLLDPVLVCS